MGPVLYVDVAWVFYGGLNYVLLTVCGRLCLLQPAGFRLVLASLLGAAFETLALLEPVPGGFKAVFALVMLAVALEPSGWREWLSVAAVFGLLNVIMTGVIFWLFFAGIFPGRGLLLWGTGSLLLAALGRGLLRCLPGLTRRATAVAVEVELAGQTSTW